MSEKPGTIQTSTSVIDQIVEELKTLPQEMRRQVLSYARTRADGKAQGMPGRALLRFLGMISSEDAKTMEEEIETGSERVDADEWYVPS